MYLIMKDNCGTCKSFVLGNRTDRYFLDEGECKDRATAYMGSVKCDTFVRKSLFELFVIGLKYRIAKLKCKISDLKEDMKSKDGANA